MNEQLASPHETYERLINEASDARRKRSLEALNQVCQLLHERETSDFTYKSIITLAQDRGLPVPGEKSIVNSTGAHYRELIQSWKLISVPSKESKTPTANNWIEMIDDPVLRLSVTLLAKELRTIKAKIARQEKASGAPIYLGALEGEGPGVPLQLKLNDAELAALKAAIDPQVLSQLGFSFGSRGEVMDAKGRKIYKPGFRDAVEKILSLQVK
nr:gamma-mobile-trio protein GmtX [uncultured Pseudomonas sp.]